VAPFKQEHATMTINKSRSAIMAGAASLSALSIPTAALTAGGSLQDTEIIELGGKLNAALVVYDPLRTQLHHVDEIFAKRNPVPRALLVRKGDQSLLGPHLHEHLDLGQPFNLADKMSLRSAPFTRAAASARAAEIVKADNEHKMLGQKLHEELAVDEITRQFDIAYDAVSEIVVRISHVTATTIEGLRVKARAAAWCRSGHEPDSNSTLDERLAWSVVRELLQAPI
jgi:hypothetical protein